MDDKKLKLRIKQKNGIKLNASREVKNANVFCALDIIPDPASAEKTLAKLQSYRSRLHDIDEEILLELGEDVMESESEKSLQFDEEMLDAIEGLAIKIRNFSKAPDINNSAPQADVAQASVKLPKLQIAKFSGEALDWQQFWDSYDNAIHSNHELNPIDKFTYLKTLLEGDALRIVDGYRLTSANYESVISNLKERFGDPQVAIFSHFEAMLALQTSSHDITQLQSVFDDCEKHIRSLVALGLPEDTFGQVFTPIVLSKLPKFVRMELHRRNGSKTWTLSKLRELLKEEIHAREMCERNFASSQTSTKQDCGSSSGSHVSSTGSRPVNKPKPPPRFMSTSSSLVSPSVNQALKCAYCDGEHYSDRCIKYPDSAMRRRQLKDRCLSCLKAGHRARECRSSRPCFYCRCKGHHRSLCNRQFGHKDETSIPVTPHNSPDHQNRGASSTPLSVNATLLSHGHRTILQTGLATVAGSLQSSAARLLFDTGCSRSFIKMSVCQKIGARHIGEDVISIAGFSDKTRKSKTYPVYEFDVLLPSGGHMTLTANSIDQITCPVQKVPLNVQKHPFVTLIPLAEPLIDRPETVEVDILIGTDYYYDFIGSEQIKCSDGLIFLSSVIGYIATGSIVDESVAHNSATALLLHQSSPIPDSNFELERFWKLEDIGIRDTSESTDDERALKFFNETVQQTDGRYEVKWPWKEGVDEIADNYQVAFGRLKSLLNRLDPDPKLKTQYDQIIRDQLQSGIIEQAPDVPDGQQLYYMPHHCVITPKKTTTKIRLVYDASSKAGKSERSLNDCILRGPVFLSDLCGMIMRSRLHAVSIVSDIEKAFLQVMLQRSDRDVTRFLWPRDPFAPFSSANIVEYRFRRVPFGINASPFLLAATIAHHLNACDSPIAREISENVYVDNILSGKPDTHEALNFYKEAKLIFLSASMNLREWYSNDAEFIRSIPEVDRGQDTTTSVLGINWDVKDDSYRCSVNSSVTNVTTKRQMLKFVSSVYDPCGFAAPVVIRGKMLLQVFWKEKYDWDTTLPTGMQRECHQLRDEIVKIPQLRIPRRICVFPTAEVQEYQLHCFCDASAKAYSAVVYLRCTSATQVTSNLVFCKSRVSPLKSLTIPRLELMSVVIGTRILCFVEAQLGLNISQRYMWSDSQCTLHWILGKEVSTVFVRNRVREINSHGNIRFRYIPTDCNPADLPSRGVDVQSWSGSKVWWNGPSWLAAEQSQWPQGDFTAKSQPDDIYDVGLISHPTESRPDSSENELFDLKRVSSLTKLLRVTSLVFRFVKKLKKIAPGNGVVSRDELSMSLVFWLKWIQKQFFEKILSKSGKRPSMVKRLGLYYDNQSLIRCRGRFDNTDMLHNTNNPILLPKHNYFVELLIMDCHKNLCHAGVKHTLSQLRYNYWITSGRNEVNRVLNKCFVCRRVEGGAFQIPPQPPLPEFRAMAKRPFSCVGIDYLGPLYIRSDTDNAQKVWVCLFTCAIVRAVHLEVIEDLSTSQFLLCLRRFVAQYGRPDIIVSDNAKNFKMAKNVIGRLWETISESREIQNFVVGEGIQWKFITEHAPWMGGFYERMVGLVKKALKKSIGGKKLTIVELQTVAYEISSVLNTRPLTYVEDDVNDSTLTPAHFLLRNGPRFPSVPAEPEVYSPQPPSSDILISEWKRIQAVVNSFWDYWRSDYLLSLREAWRSQAQRNQSSIQPQVGAVVLIKDNLPRGRWRMGQITDLVPSADGISRSAKVRLPTGKTINRPLKLLYPIEFSEIRGNLSTRNIRSIDASTTRHRRPAAVAAAERIKLNFSTTKTEESLLH